MGKVSKTFCTIGLRYVLFSFIQTLCWQKVRKSWWTSLTWHKGESWVTCLSAQSISNCRQMFVTPLSNCRFVFLFWKKLFFSIRSLLIRWKVLIRKSNLGTRWLIDHTCFTDIIMIKIKNIGYVLPFLVIVTAHY